MQTVPSELLQQIPREQVKEHLSALLASPEFADSARLSRFLKYVVEQTLGGHAAALKEYLVGVDVFDRASDYDPKTDPVVRVEARQLRFKLAAYYAAAGSPPDIVISIPKGGYGARFERNASPPAVDAPVAIVPAGSLVLNTSRGRRSTIVLLALAGVVGMAALAWRAFRPISLPPPSIAVLPFISSGGNQDNEYFNDGLADEITDGLARLHTLRVIARSSAFQFRGKSVDAREVGRQLNVTSLLEGRVSREGDRVKIVMQLVRTSDGSLIWSQVYERRLADVFAVQSEVASRIAADLGVPVIGAGARHPVAADPEAQDYYLRARFDAEKLTKDGLARAIEEYQHALARDPAYAAAWYGLAVARHRSINVRKVQTSELAQIVEGYRRAAELDPGLADAHAGLALMAMQFDWDWARAEQELKAALAVGPTATAEGHYGALLTTRGRFTEAEQHLRRALDLDPLGTAVRFNVALCRFYAGHYELARLEWERHPEITNARLQAAHMLLLEGRPVEALERFRSLRGSDPLAALFEATAQAMIGDRALALESMRNIEQQAEQLEIPFYSLAIARASIHDDKAAIEWLEKSIGRRESYLMFLAQEPAFAHLRALPNFRALQARVGLPDR